MLATLMTMLFFVVRAVEQLGTGLLREEPVPYLVYQPLPWQIQYVSQNRRGSRVDEVGHSGTNPGQGANPPQDTHKHTHTPKRAALTIQTQYRKYQQRKQNDNKQASQSSEPVDRAVRV
uniref:Secreted protein n=1 Tax=Erpetoichthys calabaricus TaxID=27687 RepID=A0A8C4SN85_ERPCA